MNLTTTQAGMIALVVLLLLWKWPRPLKSMKEVDRMTGPQFEKWCALLLRSNGFHHVKVIGKANDQGTDILAWNGLRKYAIQCKRYKGKLGNKPVQEINAGVEYYRAHVAVVMTNSYFTKGAVDAAKRCNVILWDRDKLKKMMDKAR